MKDSYGDRIYVTNEKVPSKDETSYVHGVAIAFTIGEEAPTVMCLTPAKAAKLADKIYDAVFAAEDLNAADLAIAPSGLLVNLLPNLFSNPTGDDRG